MKIVIDIPKEEYDEILSGEDCGLHTLTRAVVNGTPLPKGHGRLIDEDILHGRLRDSYLDSFGLMRVEKVLENMDAVIGANGGDVE